MSTATDRILEYLDLKGINKSRFYAATGLSNGFLDKTANPGADKLDKILSVYDDLNPYYLIGGHGDILMQTKLAPIPAPNVAPNGENHLLHLMPKVITIDREEREVVSMVPVKAAAGYLRGYGDPEYFESLPTLDLPGLSGATHRAFEIKGNSMCPTHHSGSIAIGRWVERLEDIRDRRVYILVTKHDGITMKRVLNRIKQDGKLILMSDNDNKREYPNFPIDPLDVLELWYWRASIIRESPEPGTMYTRFNELEGRLSMMEHRLRQL